MAAVLGKSVEGMERIRDLLAQERRPTILSAGEHGHQTHETLSLRMVQAHRGESVLGVTKGMTFAFSEHPFDCWPSIPDSRAMKEVNAVVIPGRIGYYIRPTGTTYIATITDDEARQAAGISSPVGFTTGYIVEHLRGGKANKMVVPVAMNGAVQARGGERVHGDSGKHVIVGPENQEFSAGNAKSPQQFHVHMDLVEAYVPMGNGMTLVYAAEGKIWNLEVNKGEVAIVPSGVPHWVEMRGDSPTFVVMASKTPIIDDKYLLDPIHLPAFESRAGT